MSDDVDRRSDRSGGFRTEIGGRLVVVTIGSKSQTLGVCTPENRPGAYERRYRFLGVPTLTPDQLDGVENIDALTRWIANFGAAFVEESGTGVRRPLPSLIPSVGPDEPWLRASAAIVEHEIDQLVIGFMEEPFLHRVEHSVHAQLFSMLTRHRELSEWHPIGTTGRRTQLVHKEWPETIADVASGSNKRGNFDLAIIAPVQLVDATLDHIRTGSVAAGIVIEMGLNYPLSHLDQDYRKLISSQVAAGYLVHLARDVRRSEEVETFLLSGDRNPQVKVAYAHCGERDDRAYKLVNDTHIRTA